MSRVGVCQQILASEPNSIIRIFRMGSSIVIKVYKGKQEQALRFLMQQMQHRWQIKSNMNGEIEFTKEQFVKLEKDNEGTPYLHIQSPYIMIEHLPIQHSKTLPKIIPSLIDSLIKGPINFCYSFENIFYNQISKNTIVHNFSSNAGLGFVLLETPILRSELAQIYELIDQGIFQRKSKARMTYQLKFRALGVIILSFMIGKKLSLLLQSQKLKDQVPFEEAMAILAQSNQRFLDLLCHPQIRRYIEQAEKRDKTNYYYFLKRVFVDQCVDLTWSQTVNLLIFQRKPQSKSNVFAAAAQRIFECQSPQKRQFFGSLGLSKGSDLQFYLLAKANINMEGFFMYTNIDEYLYDTYNWSLEKEQNCKALIKVLTECNPKQDILQQKGLKIQIQDKKKEEYFLQMQKKQYKFNAFQQFYEAFNLIQMSMGQKSIKIQQYDIRHLTNYQKILKQYRRL